MAGWLTKMSRAPPCISMHLVRTYVRCRPPPLTSSSCTCSRSVRLDAACARPWLADARLSDGVARPEVGHLDVRRDRHREGGRAAGRPAGHRGRAPRRPAVAGADQGGRGRGHRRPEGRGAAARAGAERVGERAARRLSPHSGRRRRRPRGHVPAHPFGAARAGAHRVRRHLGAHRPRHRRVGRPDRGGPAAPGRPGLPAGAPRGPTRPRRGVPVRRARGALRRRWRGRRGDAAPEGRRRQGPRSVDGTPPSRPPHCSGATRSAPASAATRPSAWSTTTAPTGPPPMSPGSTRATGSATTTTSSRRSSTGCSSTESASAGWCRRPTRTTR